MLKYLFAVALGVTLSMGSGRPLLASTQLALEFSRTGPSESIAIPLTVTGGVSTAGEWSGLVAVRLSGHGFTTPGRLTDAFYPLDPGDPTRKLEGFVQELRLSFTGCAANVEGGAPRIRECIKFVEGQGFVGTDRPAYSRDYVYHFVINVRTTPRRLTLGVGDGAVYDN